MLEHDQIDDPSLSAFAGIDREFGPVQRAIDDEGVMPFRERAWELERVASRREINSKFVLERVVRVE